jgi:long-chain fatty acid transport protein
VGIDERRRRTARARLRGAIAAACLVACGFSARRAAASPEDLFGYGGRTSAMGATGVTHATGYETAWHNPALASTIRQNKLTLGYTGAVFALDAVGPGLPGRASVQPAKGTVIGADVPLPLGGRLRDRVGFALGFYTPTAVIVRGRVLYPERTQFPLLPDRSQSLALRGGVGVDVGWGLRAGVGFAALAEISGTVVAAADVTGRVGTRVEDQLVATYAPTVGVSWDVPGRSRVRIGATVRGKLDARFQVTVDATKLSSIAIPLLNISGLAQYDPAQAAVEIARIEKLNVLALQAVYKRWSDFPGVLEPTVSCSEGGPGACGIVPPKIGWRDSVVVRVGAEQGFELAPGLTLRGRGGGFIETSALPDTLPTADMFDVATKAVVSVPTRYFDSTRAVVTTGIGVALDRGLTDHREGLPPIDVDFFVQYHLLLPRTITSVDGTGAAYSQGESSGHVKVFGLTAGVRL